MQSAPGNQTGQIVHPRLSMTMVTIRMTWTTLAQFSSNSHCTSLSIIRPRQFSPLCVMDHPSRLPQPKT